MLSRELTQVAESGKVGSQISDYICHTFLGKGYMSINFLTYYLVSKVSCRDHDLGLDSRDRRSRS